MYFEPVQNILHKCSKISFSIARISSALINLKNQLRIIFLKSVRNMDSSKVINTLLYSEQIFMTAPKTACLISIEIILFCRARHTA